MAPDSDKRNICDKNVTKRIKSIVVTMLYNERSLDPTMLRDINENLRVQSQPTHDTTEKAKMLLDYDALYLNAIIPYKASDMVLHVDSHAEYITMTEARTCYAGHFYLSD